MSSEKRKKVVVSMEQKLEALQRLDKGETMHKVAEEYGVGRVTVGDWKKKRSEIEKWCSARASNEGLKERKTMKKCEYEKVSEALFLWFTQQRENGVPITGPLLQEKALFFHKEFNEGESDFTASIGWIDRWKKRYGVRQLNICGEKLSADSESPFKFREQFKSFMKNEGLSYEQLYNCDETGLNFKMLASKTLASREEKSALGYKRSKGGVTILAGYNASVYQAPDLDVETVIVGSAPVPADTPDQARWPSQEVPQQAPPGTKQVVAPSPPVKKTLTLVSQPSPKPAVTKQAPPRPVSPPQPPPPPPEVCLRWNSYHSNMQATFPSLLNNEQFVDVTLACEGRSIKCHKMMLSACSSYFEELLSQNPCQHPIVLMKDLKFWEVQALVDFMYRGEVNVGQDKLPSLLAAAEALQIKGLAGPASTSSSHDEDSLPPSLALATDDYLDESTSSPSSARRARKRRTIASMPTPRQNTISPHRNPVGRPRLMRPSPQPSTSTYQLASMASEPPLRRARRSEPTSLPVGEIKIEPVDIDISNDSMDPIDDRFDMNKTYDGSGGGGDANDSSRQGDEVGGDTRGGRGGGTQENSGNLSDDNRAITSGHDSDHMDYGNNTGMNSESTVTPAGGESKTEIQSYSYAEERTDNPGMSSDMNPTYPEVVLNPGADSASSDSILGHL